VNTRGAWGLVAAVTALALPALGSSADGTAPQFNPPKRFYVALGDSITYGFQSSKFVAGLPPSAYDTGYTDVFAARLRSIRPDSELVNYGCPGESTRTFIAGPCGYPALGGALHDAYVGSQLDAATGFLRAHAGQVGPITLHLFGNDVNELVALCGGDFACIQREAPAAIAGLASRLALILDRLRGAAPNIEIVVIGGWGSAPVAVPEVDALIHAANDALATVTALRRSYFADAASIFNPPAGARTAAICQLTLLCTQGDGHPSDAGYRAIADLVFEASRYGRLGE